MMSPNILGAVLYLAGMAYLLWPRRADPVQTPETLPEKLDPRTVVKGSVTRKDES